MRLRAAHGEHRATGMPHHVVDGGPREVAGGGARAVDAHYDQVHLVVVGTANDFACGDTNRQSFRELMHYRKCLTAVAGGLTACDAKVV